MFNAYSTSSFILLEKTGKSEWGEKTEKATELCGRIDFKFRMVRDFEGKEVVSSAKITIPNREVDPSARVKIDGKEYPILNVTKEKAFSKNYLTVLQIG